MNKEIQKLLSSSKTEDISKGLELFERKGSTKELAIVLDILSSKNAEVFEKQITEAVSNIKAKEANTIIIDAILKARKNKGNIPALMQICWQSQLDFTKNLALFTDIFIDGDYIVALEALTVIENIWADYSYNKDHQQLLVDTIKDSFGKMDKNKLILAKELLLVLEG